MSQSQENLQTDRQTEGRIEGWTEGQTDRPYFIGTFHPRPGVQKGMQYLR